MRLKHFVGRPILAAAGFQRHDATGSRWIEPVTAPRNRFVENKWFIGAVTGEPALGPWRKGRPMGPCVQRSPSCERASAPERVSHAD